MRVNSRWAVPKLRSKVRAAALADRHAASLVLLGKFAADADAEDEPALGQVIQSRDLLGDRRRMAQRQQVDAGAEHQPPADLPGALAQAGGSATAAGSVHRRPDGD